MGADIAMLIGNMQQFEAVISTAQLKQRAQYTLDAMNALARYLVGIPGRKNVLWFSGSFPLDVMPDPDSPMANMQFMNVSDSNAEYRETISLLSRAQVAVYPVDARGVTVLPSLSVAGDGGNNVRYVHNGAAVAQDNRAFMGSTFEENNTMRNMAYQTGGQAFLNTNNLTEAVANAMDNGTNYYTLTYTPVDAVWKGDFRKIVIRLQQHGLNLSYRRGYYADDPDAPPSTLAREVSGRAVAAPMPSQPNFGAMHLALMHTAAPIHIQIVFTVQVLPMKRQHYGRCPRSPQRRQRQPQAALPSLQS